MSQEITVSKEDYLKAIIEAESEGHTVIAALLAQWLEVSAPAVTKAVKRLREDGYIEAGREGALKLTAKGRVPGGLAGVEVGEGIAAVGAIVGGGGGGVLAVGGGGEDGDAVHLLLGDGVVGGGSVRHSCGG